MSKEKNKSHLITIEDLTDENISQVFTRAAYFLENSVRSGNKLDLLKNKTLFNLFFENSTRTRTSFELAAKNLGATVINIQVENSSVKKGETIEDTCLTINAMHPDFMVARHNASGIVSLMASYMDCSVINAGDGCHQHPTQALLDAFIISRKTKGFKGLNVTICGDILHSRVARSNMALLGRLGASVTVVAPPTLMPLGVEAMGVKAAYSLEPVLEKTEVLILLRLQNERMAGSFVPSARDYFYGYGIENNRLSKAKKDILILHPGPVNRGVELSGDIASDKEKTEILNQVEAGVAIRMAVLELLA